MNNKNKNEVKRPTIKKKMFTYLHIQNVIKFLDIDSLLTCLKLNAQFKNETKKCEAFRLIKWLKDDLNACLLALPLNYFLSNSAEKLVETLQDYKNKFRDLRDYKVIEYYVGKWIYSNYLTYLQKQDTNFNSEADLKTPVNLNLSNKSISTEGTKYLFSSLINFGECSINFLNLSSNKFNLKDCKIINGFSNQIKFKLRKLDVSNNELDDMCLTDLLKFIGNLNLGSLNLSKNLLVFSHSTILCKTHIFQNIKDLNLSYNKLTPDSAKYISLLVSNGSHLTDLNLEGNELEMEGIKLLTDTMISNKELELLSLNISRNKIGVDGTIYFSRLFNKEHCRIRSLDISENKIEGTGARSLCESLVDNKFLEELNLKGNAINSFDQNSVKIMYETLLSNTVIQKINLASNSIDDKSIYFLANSLLKNKTLKILILDNNKISDKGAIYLADSFKKYCSLTEISLMHNINLHIKPFNLDVQYLNNFYNIIGNDSISSNQSLPLVVKFAGIVKLNLSDNLYNSEDLRTICLLIAESNNNLKELNLSSNKITAEGAHYLADLLINTQTTIRTLILSDNDLDEDGAVHIGEIIKNNIHLQVLCVDYNHLSWNGIHALIEGFKNNASSKIKYLDLKGNYITDIGVPYITQIIKKGEIYYDQIKELDLSCNEITNNGIKLISMALGTNCSLEKIKLSGNKVDKRGAEYLMEYLSLTDTFDRIEIDYQEIN
jgi:Ran GTPase-activating protein (RanGAP) involved in mRNA processing and transport